MNRLWWDDKIIALKCSNFQFSDDEIGMYSIGRRKKYPFNCGYLLCLITFSSEIDHIQYW